MILIDSKLYCTDSGIGNVLLESSMTAWEEQNMFSSSALSESLYAYILLHLREVGHKSRISNIKELF